MIKIPILDCLRAVWQTQLKIARDFCSVNDCWNWLRFLKHPLLCILCSDITVSRHSKVTWRFSVPVTDFFENVHIRLSPSVVLNWCTYFMTKEAEVLKAVFSNVTSVSEDLDFQSNSGHMESSQVQWCQWVFSNEYRNIRLGERPLGQHSSAVMGNHTTEHFHESI